MTRNVPENNGPQESAQDWATMRPEDFDTDVSPTLFDVPAAPVTGGLFDLLDDDQGDNVAGPDAAAVPVGEPIDAVHDLLAAVLDALDIPHPATVGGTEAHDRALNDRAMHVKIALRDVLDGAPLGVEWTTAYLRERLAEHPPTGYVTGEQARAVLAAGKTWAEAVAFPGEGR